MRQVGREDHLGVHRFRGRRNSLAEDNSSRWLSLFGSGRIGSCAHAEISQHWERRICVCELRRAIVSRLGSGNRAGDKTLFVCKACANAGAVCISIRAAGTKQVGDGNCDPRGYKPRARGGRFVRMGVAS